MPTRKLPPLVIAKASLEMPTYSVVGMSETGVREVPEAVARAFAKRFGVSVAEMATSIGAKPTADSKRTLLQPATVHESWSWVLTQSNRGPKTYGARQGGVRAQPRWRTSATYRSPSHWSAVSEEQLAAVAEGALLGSYDYEPISAEPATGGTVGAITVIQVIKAADVVTATQIVAQAVVTVREFVNLPANLLYPESFAEQVRNLVRGSKIIIDVLDETALIRAATARCWQSAVDPPGRHGWSGSATAPEEPGSSSPCRQGHHLRLAASTSSRPKACTR